MQNSRRTISVELLQQPQLSGLKLNISKLNKLISLLDQPIEDIKFHLNDESIDSTDSTLRKLSLDSKYNHTPQNDLLRPQKDVAQVNQDLDHLLSSLSQYKTDSKSNMNEDGTKDLYTGQIVTSKPPPSSAGSNSSSSGPLQSQQKPPTQNSSQLYQHLHNSNSFDTQSDKVDNNNNISRGSCGNEVISGTISTSGIPLCLLCNEPVYDKSIAAMGGYWHQHHFICHGCEAPLDHCTYYIDNDQPYCEMCHINFFTDKCAYCGEPILDTALTALDQQWHPEHFFCSLCQGPFENDAGFHEHQGKPYCADCYFDNFGQRCSACHQPITGTFLNAMGSIWHDYCFCCKICQTPFESMNFRELNGEPYCDLHYYQSVGSICVACNKPVTGTVVNAIGHRYHVDCFKCSYCTTKLAKCSFKENGGQPYCISCHNKLFP